MQQLPVQEVLPELLSLLRHHPSVVLEAPPGAGKTTLVPLALLREESVPGRILVLEPRRLAALNAARRMASLLGEEVGRTVGYAVRFDRVVSRDTRIEVVTEGILARRLQGDPLLDGVSAVIFDEFHERSIHSDLALALCLDVQRSLRDDLKLVVMSATLDAEPVATLLGAPVVRSEGRSFPVEVRYRTAEPKERVEETAVAGVAAALAAAQGDILVFLPGVAEIRRTADLLGGRLAGGGVIVTPLYGDLPLREQERAIRPGPERKVVLATNVAETSVTIEGIAAVVDCGWTRRSRFDPSTGLNRLVTARVSAASAAQRAGRAGRLGPGVCYRMWTRHTQERLHRFDPPEIASEDLSPLLLELAQWGVADPVQLSWVDPPPAAAVAEGRMLLALLGLVDARGIVTPAGGRAADLGTHPRLAAIVLGAAAREKAGACDLAALLSERDIIRHRDLRGGVVTDNDFCDRLQLLQEWRSGRYALPCDSAACAAVDRLARELRRRSGAADGADLDPVAVARLLALGYPDRIGRRREGDEGRYLLVSGKGVRLSRRSGLARPPYLVAPVVMGEERGEGIVHLAASLDEALLRREFASSILTRRRVEWHEEGGKVVARREESLGALVLSSAPVEPTREEAGTAFAGWLRDRGRVDLLPWTPEAARFRNRVAFLRKALPEEEWPDLGDAALLSSVEEWLPLFLPRLRTSGDLRSLDMLAVLRSFLSRQQLQEINAAAPTHVAVPSGSRIAIDYGDEEPVLAVKLQELFGLAQTPRVARGRVPLVVHLLSPAGRPVQVTRDLEGFWNRGYHEVKKELRGRYPKHPWPDDPWNTSATRHAKRRG